MRSRPFRALFVCAALISVLTITPNADSTAQTLPFFQDWTDTGRITTANDWSGVAGIIGYRGDGLLSGTGRDPQLVVADGAATPVNVIANQTNPNTLTTGGVAEFHLANSVIALQGSGTANAPHIVISVSAIGRSNIQISYNLRDIDGSADNAVQPVALQYRIGASGSYTNLPAGFVADASQGPSLATLVTPVSVNLPAAADNQLLVQLRIITADAVGSDEWIGIDDISVTGIAAPAGELVGTISASPDTVSIGDTTTLTVDVTPGTNPASTGITVTADLSAIGGSAAQPFDASGNTFTFTASIPSGVTAGAKTLRATIRDAEGRSAIATTSVTVVVPTPPSALGAASPASVEVTGSTTLTVTVTPGTTPPSTGLQVAADLSSIGGSSAQPFFNDGTNGDVTAGDNKFTFTTLVSADTVAGPKSILATVTDAQGRTGATTIGLIVVGPAPKGVVISQIYGAGSNSGALFRNDYIELYNSTSADVDLTGWSVQYSSAAGTSWTPTPLTGTIGAGRYFLVKESGGTNGTPLPPADASGNIAMAAGSGKVALVNNTNALSGDCPAASLVVADFVGYGSAATCAEGSGPTGTLSATTAALRINDGATDTDDNAADFDVTTPRPRSAAGIPPTGTGLAIPQAVSAGGSSLLTVAVTPGSLPTSTTLTVSADLSAIGGAPSVTFVDDGSNGDRVANDNVFSTTAIINGTPAVRTLTATISDSSARTSTAAIRIGINATTTTAIYTIQGNGSRSPFDGAYVTTTGVVTALKFNGVFVQAPTGDGDPDTSDGILVFTGGAPPAFLTVGDAVMVSGTVQEFVPSADPDSPPATEIINAAFAVSASGQPLPAPVVLAPAFTDPAGGLEQLERFEGMRIRTDLLVIAPTQAASSDEKNATSVTNGIFYGVIRGVARPMREPGLEPEQILPPGSPAGVPHFDGNPERLRVDSDALLGAATLDVVAGQTFTDFTGVLDYAFRSYMILPDPRDAGGLPWQPSGSPLAVPAPDAGANEFTVSHFNLERFFDSIDEPGKSDVALTPAAVDGRLNKASLAIRHVLRAPDILGVVEVENLDVLQQLAARISADAIAAGEPDPRYAAYLHEGNDIGGIDVGFLVKQAGDKVRVLDVTQIGKDTDFTFAGDTAKLNDRPSLVLEADVLAPTGRAFPVTVIVNHLRSLSGIDGTDGDRIRHKRRAQAEFLADSIQSRQAANPAEWIVSVGDYNAFQFSDGYVDVMGTIVGRPAPADSVVLASADLVNPDLTNLVTLMPPAQQYSFSFDGNAQVLDHVLVNAPMLKRFARMAYGRVDADFPEAFRGDTARPERVSDHDAPVAYFTFPGAPSIRLNEPVEVTVEYKGTFVDPGVTATDPDYPVTVTMTGAVDTNTPGDYTLTYTASNGFLSSSITRTVHVVDTKPPVITLIGGTAMTIEAAAAFTDPGATAIDERAGDLTAAIQVTGEVKPRMPGIYTLQYRVSDGFNTAAATRTVTVVDTTAPIVSAIAASQIFTKTRGDRTVDVTLTYVASDLTGLPSCALTVAPVAPLRKDKGRTDDITWQIVDVQHVRFTGKINDDEKTPQFAITATCADGSGNSSAAATTVTLLTKDDHGSDGRNH
jgi:predicted extracellular nuclease